MVPTATLNPIPWLRELSNRATPDAKLLLWMIIATAISIALPLVVFTGARAANDADSWDYMAEGNDQNGEGDWYDWKNGNNQYQGQYGQNQYNGQQQQQEDEYNGYNNAAYGNAVQQNGYWANYEAQQEQAAEQENNCGWFDWGCEEGEYSPRWWKLVKSESDEDTEPTGLLLAVYFWTLAFLIYVIIVARRISITGASVGEMSSPFLMLAGYSITGMLFLGGLTGAIRDDGWGVAENGWYGQTGVLLYMTYMCSFVMGIFFYFLSAQLGDEEGQRSRQTKMGISSANQHLTLKERVKKSLYPRSS
eukprot:CAMPEP_0172457160 /NCGR_PEP_ID=MMETSP1065-20121228/20408_1 /TAXON_ID=265537 /ORGANISM="Amphiprora paludosa, Strain CCMP125" /LENGTH=305 /DNA_ID=CAMNT_0013210715 /DNA_START=102 /DNA_END=1019 /DNA_ORIENTATION=+